MDNQILMELVDGILKIMRDNVISIILYGSAARGTNAIDSDIAVLRRGSLERETEERLSELIADMNLEYDKVFSVIDIDYKMFCIWENVTPFYRNVTREGIVLWRAA